MTIFPAFFRPQVPLETTRERFELPDGDFVDLDWVEPLTESPAATLFLLHGLEGSIDSPHIRGTLLAAQKRGWRGVLMHFRGCSGEPNRHPRAYHAGETQDPRHVIEAVEARYPDIPLFGAGFSLGGNVLLKHLGEAGEATVLEGAAVVSVPLVLSACSRRLRRGFSRVYDRYLVQRLKASLRARRAAVDMGTVGEVDDRKLTTVFAYDEHIQAPLHGFEGAEDYYVKCSSRQFLNRIQVPTLILHAVDDPFMTPEVVPTESELSEHVTVEVSAQGGHVGFVHGPPWRPSYWYERRIPEFLAETIA